ncbi:MAG: DNA repair protein RadC [Bacilli bacterium]|jgi:DNA repair protein RadC|nr:DNA repair protein RadC [Bacilli bacterium]
MKMMMEQIPTKERPRERLEKMGSMALADYELLAILLRTGTKEQSVMEVARALTMHFEPLFLLSEATLEEMMAIDGIGKTKAIELQAAIELGRRMAESQVLKDKLTSPQMIYDYVRHSLQNLKQENALCLFLNVQNQVIAKKTLSIGTLEYTVFHPRDILKWGLKYSAYSIVLVHNHPSGNASPSPMDKKMTHVICDACDTVGIKLIDHIIIGANCFFSFAEQGLLKR